MRIDELGLPAWFVDRLKAQGVEVLYPHQVEAIEKGLLDGNDLVVTTPTASGKTLIASIAALRHLSSGRKVLYLTPFKSLTNEKYIEFNEVFSAELGFKLAASSSDFDDPGYRLRDKDMIIATYEKADSLIRHRFQWFDEVGLVVVDEAHLLGDPERGPTLEMLICKLKSMGEYSQVLCLSATIRNAEEVADWLGATVVKSDFRPVPLVEGVLWKSGNKILWSDGTHWELRSRGDPLVASVIEFLSDGGQVLVFAMTRRKAEQFASKIASVYDVVNLLGTSSSELLREAADRAIEVDPDSPHSERLAALLTRGVAYHHAGLSYQHRDLVERLYRDRILPIICATPTLSAGVNLPARAVIIPELWRFDARNGYEPLSVMEYKQFCGRAGRPRYDVVGYAVTIANRDEDVDLVFNRYISGTYERIVSHLGDQRHLRSQVLSLIASGVVRNGEQLTETFSRTFYAHQFGRTTIMGEVLKVLRFLIDNEMVTGTNVLRPTSLGKRVSELYIDPLTAVTLKRYMGNLEGVSGEGLLQLVCLTPEVSELNVTRLRRGLVETYIAEHEDELVVRPVEEAQYEEFLDSMKNWVVMREWINELPDRQLYNDFKVEPGDFLILKERVEWISYAAWHLCEVLGYAKEGEGFRALTERVKHGVKQELLELVSLPGIGRVKGRALWREGIRTIEDVRRASVAELARIVGQKTAEKLKDYLER